MTAMLQSRKEQEGTRGILHPEGRIDTLTAPDFEAEVQRTAAEHEELVLDFSGVEYISSAGLRVLLAAHKAMSRKGGLSLYGVGEAVSEVFELTGFCDVLNITDEL